MELVKFFKLKAWGDGCIRFEIDLFVAIAPFPTFILPVVFAWSYSKYDRDVITVLLSSRIYGFYSLN